MRRGLMSVPLVVAALALGACNSSSDADSTVGRIDDGSKAPSAITADPPLAFDTTASVPLPATALQSNLARQVTSRFTTLRDRTAYIVEPATLRAIDVLTGKQKWQAGIDGTPSDPNAQRGPFVSSAGPRPPMLSDDGKTVVVAVPIAEPGKGTTPGHQAISVLAVDADTGKTSWSTKVAVSGAVSGGDRTGSVTSVVAVTDSAVVVAYRNDAATTVAIDPSNQKILWQRDEYEAGAVSGDIVVGTDSKVAENSSMVQATALDLIKGEQRWTAATRASQAAVIPANPALIVVDRIDYGTGDAALLFLDPKTGQERASFPINRPFGLGSSYGPCLYDQRSILICFPSDYVTAFDATNGKWLQWELPDQTANRVAPRVTTAWHGMVYGRTSNGPVVLDAATGKDQSTAPGAAPYWVSEYAGIGIDDQGAPVAFGVKKQ